MTGSPVLEEEDTTDHYRNKQVRALRPEKS